MIILTISIRKVCTVVFFQYSVNRQWLTVSVYCLIVLNGEM